MAASSDDLPLPMGPTTATKEPGAIRKLTSCRMMDDEGDSDDDTAEAASDEDFGDAFELDDEDDEDEDAFCGDLTSAVVDAAVGDIGIAPYDVGAADDDRWVAGELGELAEGEDAFPSFCSSVLLVSI